MTLAPPDVIVVSIGATAGWRGADRGLTAALEATGVSVAFVPAGPVPKVRTFMLTDLVEAAAARRAAQCTLERLGASPSRPGPAIIYCSITAALLWPRPGAIWLDALARENRPGRHGLWQRHVETRRLASAPVILAMAPAVLDSLSPARRPPAVIVPVAVDPSGPLGGPRDIDVVAYAGDPVKRRLDVILEAWARVRREGEKLVVAGLERSSAPPGVRFAGRLEPVAFRALLRRARVYATAPRREDFGITPLQALADGCQLVSTPAPGAYPALALARQLDPRLVSTDLSAALRTALDTSDPDYPQRARSLLAPYRTEAVQARLATDVLPRLLPGWRGS